MPGLVKKRRQPTAAGSRRRTVATVLVVVGLAVSVLGVRAVREAPGSWELDAIAVRPSLEHRLPDGSPYSPATLSLLRGHSWLETVERLKLRGDHRNLASLTLSSGTDDHYLMVDNLPLEYLVPRLHYRPADPPDAFDAFNLMMAEYSRNGVSLPRGRTGDDIAHYQTSLDGSVPWQLAGDFDFRPDPDYRPQRVAVVNNCLAPGLWELSAEDRSGEIYHAWFDFPLDRYFDLVAATNRLPREFVERALAWSEHPVTLDLDRLRRVVEHLGEVEIEVVDEAVSYSSQGSRRKIARRFALVEKAGALEPPAALGELLEGSVALASFIPPGIYSQRLEERTRFDFRFLAHPERVEVRRVTPLTSYRFDVKETPDRSGIDDYVELTLHLGEEGAGTRLVLGNLPLPLLVRQQDFVIDGFGVGILEAGALAERRRLLLELGPRPSFAYLVRDGEVGPEAINSHARGIEQVFVRSRADAEPSHWEVTLTSYERIVDLVRYRIAMPVELIEAQRRHSDTYIPPIYFSYRDDNVN